MKKIHKPDSIDSDQHARLNYASKTRWVISLLVLCAVLATIALVVSLVMPGQLLAGGAVTWAVVGALMTGVVLVFRFSS